MALAYPREVLVAARTPEDVLHWLARHERRAPYGMLRVPESLRETEGAAPSLRYEFVELPVGGSTIPRPPIPVQIEDLEEAPQLCLVDTGSYTNRFGAWLADAVGIDLAGAPEETSAIGGFMTNARLARADLTVAETRYDAPISFCDPWPFAFNLLSQEGFCASFG